MSKGSLAPKISTHPEADNLAGKEKALSTTVTLEEEIEKLHWMKVHSGSEWRPRGRDHWRPEERRKNRCHQVSFAKPTHP